MSYHCSIRYIGRCQYTPAGGGDHLDSLVMNRLGTDARAVEGGRWAGRGTAAPSSRFAADQ